MEAVITPTSPAGPPAREALFEELYERAFPLTARFVSQLGGSFQDAKDIFQDALLLYYEKSTEESFAIRKAPEAYILGIAKHLWNRKFRYSHRLVSLTAAEEHMAPPAEPQKDVDNRRLLAYLEKSGRRCLDLLRAFYYEKLPMKQIAGNMGYASDRSATVQKYKCLEKVRDALSKKSIGYEDFLN
jgi:RNA polymerase sigma factor (sigma-70 family)